MFETVPMKLLLSVVLGAAIGLERESRGNSDDNGAIGGIRTFALASLLGGLAGVLFINNLQTLFLVVTVVFSLLLVSYYIVGALITKRTGLTNELSFLYTFLIGFLIAIPIFSMQLVIAIFVVLMLILASKSKSKQLMGGVSRHELESFISYAIIALVVLPFLPNTGYTVSDIPFLPSLLEGYGVGLGKFATLEILNPRRIWLVVVLVTGIDVFGYLMAKFLGSKKSFSLTSFVGGFISSTSTTQSLAQKSRRGAGGNYLVGAAVLANLASFFQIILLVGPLNSRWLIFITPTLLILMAVSTLAALYFLRKKEEAHTENISTKNKKIFSLLPALQFAGLLILVKFFTKISLVIFGQSGFIVSSVIASFAGIDAIVINLAEMAGGAITLKFALLTFILVNASNLISKSVYSYVQGSRSFALRFSLSVAVMIIATFGGLLFT